ncbi:helix-turn-helix domain-containing protein [Sphingobacterium sp. LRF_L2]|uniref:helix-turn-helix domain-containing protein n=1 Tax=Sphingobacterium sp. LRF_L2 TaxID=3369421 RepID=UPI003F647D9C
MKKNLEKINIFTLTALFSQTNASLGEIKDLFLVIRTLGPLALSIGQIHYHIPANKLVFISPGNLIAPLTRMETKGYGVTFSASFFDRSDKDSEILYSRLFFDYEKQVQITDSISSEEEAKDILKNRVPAFARKSKILYHALLRKHIESILLEGLFSLPEQSYETTAGGYSDRSLGNAFLVLVNKYCKEQTKVSYYADLLNVTPRKLSTACQQIFGQTAKQIISETLVKKAINYFQHSNLSISQIAFEMGFSDESNFRRFIKTHTGKTALSFRYK